MEPTLKFFQGQNVPVEHFEATGRIIFFRFTLSKGIRAIPHIFLCCKERDSRRQL